MSKHPKVREEMPSKRKDKDERVMRDFCSFQVAKLMHNEGPMVKLSFESSLT